MRTEKSRPRESARKNEMKRHTDTMLYQMHDFSHMMVAPFRFAAEVTQAAFRHPYHPMASTRLGRTIAAGAELIERTTRRYSKPAWHLDFTEIDGKKYPVKVEAVLEKPFCDLLHFNRKGAPSGDPKVLLVAPMSGHHATLLRGTVEAMLPHHEVYITDWMNAHMVPLNEGPFDLEDNISYIMDFIRHIGPECHVMAICQPAPATMCAISLLAQMKDKAQPRSMILMGGPIDTRVAPTTVTKLAEERPISWFERTVLTTVPPYYPGAGRRDYPGFVQLSGFMSMHLAPHV